MFSGESKLHQRLLSLVCVLMSAHFAIAYTTLSSAMVPFHGYNELNGGGGAFAYRMLPALLWKLTVFLVAPLARRHPHLHMPLLNPPFTTDESWFVVLLTFAAMLGTLTIARWLMRCIDSRPAMEWLALGIGYAAYFDTILVLNRNLYYPYDITALFFFTWLVYLAWQGRAIGFALVLLFAVLNKETAAMAILLFFGFEYGRRPLGSLAAICAGMSGMVVGIRILQRAYILHLCAICQQMAQNQLVNNLHQLPNPLFWLSELSVFGYAYIAAIVFWRFIPVRVRVTSMAVFALWLSVMTIAGVLREVRIFSELSALLLLMVGLGAHRWLETRRTDAAI
jgi:hypothetical protein